MLANVACFHFYPSLKGSGRLEKQNWASRFVNDIRILEAEKFDQSMTFFVGHIEPSQINARSEVQST